MSPNNSRLISIVGAVLAVFVMAGCGRHDTGTVPSSSGSPTSGTSAPSTTTSTGAQFDIGNTINYVSTGTTTTLDCGDGKSLNIGGFNNTLTVKGTCSMVSVGGGDNTITVDSIDKRINVVGSHNSITYKAGTPKVENLGSGNTINKAG